MKTFIGFFILTIQLNNASIIEEFGDFGATPQVLSPIAVSFSF